MVRKKGKRGRVSVVPGLGKNPCDFWDSCRFHKCDVCKHDKEGKITRTKDVGVGGQGKQGQPKVFKKVRLSWACRMGFHSVRLDENYFMVCEYCGKNFEGIA